MSHTQVQYLDPVRTKIVATVGPASSDPKVLRKLIEAGADLFRLNFSHGEHSEHTQVLQSIRDLSQELGVMIGVLQDLSGPKIRLGLIPGDEVDCPLDAEFRLVADRTGDDPSELTSTYRQLPQDLTTGDAVLFADGTVGMVVTEVGEDWTRLRVTLAGRLRSRQGINLPGAKLSVNALTEKDLRDLDWTIDHPVDYVGLSFVRSASDVVQLRQELANRQIDAKIVAKIEKPQAVKELEAILAVSDAVMVARGDLGVEMDVAEVPAIQKRIINACHHAQLPVITATQMLESMTYSSRPTRAEASDVFNAVLDGTDAVMLSGETAIGAYPVETVATMNRIVGEAERMLPAVGTIQGPPIRSGWLQPITEAVVESAGTACRKLHASLLVVASHSGRTAQAASKLRQKTPTLALSDQLGNARRMSLYWGVTPLYFPEINDVEHAMNFAMQWAKDRGLVAPGDRVVLLRGTLPTGPAHNELLVQEV